MAAERLPPDDIAHEPEQAIVAFAHVCGLRVCVHRKIARAADHASLFIKVARAMTSSPSMRMPPGPLDDRLTRAVLASMKREGDPAVAPP